MNIEIFSIAGIIFLVSMTLYLFPVKNRIAVKAGRLVFIAGVISLLAGFVSRWMFYYTSMDQNLFLSFPVTSLYESVTFCISCTAFAYIVFEYKTKFTKAGWIISLVAGSGLLLLNLTDVSSQAVLFVPALQSYWLIAHVLLSFLAYACFTVAGVLGIYIVLLGKCLEQLMVKMVIYHLKQFIISGLVLFTVGGLLFGSVWAQTAWGRFWSWDPKETWAFITWCIYLTFVHVIRRYSLKDRTVALYAAVSFIFVVFTFLGVNLIMSGLHSYGAS